MVGTGWLIQSVLGVNVLADGMPCTPGTGLSVSVGPGVIFAQVVTDATGYGSLGTDSTLVMKQGLSLLATALVTPAPTTSGQSTAYLIEAQYQDLDTEPEVLPYFNSANPARPYSGPANDGAPQDSLRAGVCALQILAGTPATTGSQVTPTPTSGWVGLWVVTVPFGATTISSGEIALYPSAPFIAETLTQKISEAAADARYRQPSLPGLQVFTATGNFTVPAGVFELDIEGWAPSGGSGGASGATGVVGSGSGAGEYRRGFFAVTPGQVIPVTFGTPGAAGTPTTNGGNATNTLVGTSGALLTLGGGHGGQSNAAVGGAGGSGGSGGQIVYPGQGGGTCAALSGSSLGGVGGAAFKSPGAGFTLGAVGNGGSFPGAGSSGASTNGNGAPGNAGQVNFRW